MNMSMNPNTNTNTNTNGKQDILVIDDEPMITLAVRKVCSAEGMTVSTADHAAEAFRYLEESEFRLILCDIMMNECDGFQFLEQCASKNISTPVVMMTGYSTVENAVRSLVAGAVDYIPKPFTADELLAVVQRSLRSGMLLNEAEPAGQPGNGSGNYIPCPAHYYQLGHVSWILMEDEGTARIGVNDVFLKAVGGIKGFELSEPGEELIQGSPCAVVLAMDGTRHDIMCPLSGKVIELNAQAQSAPELIEKEPYVNSWLYRILPSDPESNLQWFNR